MLAMGFTCVLADSAAAQCSATCDANGDYKSVTNADWDLASTWYVCNYPNWEPAGAKPGSSNKVTICRGTSVTVDTGESCGNLVLESALTGSTVEGVLLIKAGGGDLTVAGTLTMHDPDSGQNPCRIEFTGTGAAAVLDFSNSVTAARQIVVDGPGKIEIAATKKLTLSGAGIIKGKSGNTDPLEIAGAIENDGDIEVKEAFTLKFTGTGLELDSSGTITVEHASAVVQWMLDTSALDTVDNVNGDVLLNAGKLDFDSPLLFYGNFEMKANATVDTEGLANDTTAKFCDGASCTGS